MKAIAKWVLLFVPAIIVELICYVLNPFVAILTRKELRTDKSKRLGGVVTIERDYLVRPLMYFQSHDNAVDEWWYDLYNEDSFFKSLREATQEQYDNSWWLRYVCRVMWLYRNNAYGFLFYWFSTPVEALESEKIVGTEDNGNFWMHYQAFKRSFKLEAQLPILFTKRYLSVNIGWKEHRSAPLPQKMYANRFIGVRKYE